MHVVTMDVIGVFICKLIEGIIGFPASQYLQKDVATTFEMKMCCCVPKA